MPRSKPRKNKQKDAQDTLTTRLMQISLKMDDHIYYNKLISPTNAENYLQEIAKLKSSCPRTNVRALQVIEKLTRCMKNIISEAFLQPAYLTNSFVQQNDYSQSCSPVYSLPDEDRTEHFTLVNDTVDDIPIIDITEHSDEIKGSEEYDNVIENVKNAITNMFLQDDFVNQACSTIADNDCSQSILENFHNDNTAREPNSETDIYTVYVPIIKPVDLTTIETSNNGLECLFVTSPNAPKDIAVQNVPDSFHQQNINGVSSHVDIELVDLTNESKDQPSNKINKVKINETLRTTCPQSMVKTECGNKIAPNTIKTKNSKGPVEKDKPLVPVRKRKDKKIRRKKNKEIENTKQPSQVYNTEMGDKKNCKKKNTRNIVVGRHTKSVDISRNKPISTIYNKNVVNDLSWVENLRYVREVSPEENDPTLSDLQDNFWNNFSLPSNWNELDFEI